MSEHDDRKARFRRAIETGLSLGRRGDEIERLAVSGDHKAIMIEQLADEWIALFEEYPDVFPDPPVSVETLRAHAQQLREAAEEARRSEAAYEKATADVKEAERKVDAALNEIAAPRRKPDKPS